VRTRRGATELSGILAIDKPQGMTSHDVVNRVRRATGERRVGHAGTLDPMATGLLVVLIGPATRLGPYLTAENKCYEARVVFGAETDTDDADGRITSTAGVPDEVCDPFVAAGILGSLVGVHQQVPPAYSAVKRDGVTAYKAARDGKRLELGARTIEVTEAQLIGVSIDPPAWDVGLGVSKGTYIRALARDLGRACDTAAHLGALTRTRSGHLTLADAHALDDVESARDVRELFADPVASLGLPVVDVAAEEAQAVSNGCPLTVAEKPGASASIVAIRSAGRLVAVYALAGTTASPLTVIPNGVMGKAI
jgi:tRNA pseudouridine55 synthase